MIISKSQQIEIATAVHDTIGTNLEIDGAWYTVSRWGSELRFRETSAQAARSAHVDILRHDLAYAPTRPTPYQYRDLEATCTAIVTAALASLQ